MKQSRFITITFILFVVFVFFKIYQHNQLVKLMYKRQRIEKTTEEEAKKKNGLLVELYEAKDLRLIKTRAEQELGMRFLQPSQIVTVSAQIL